MQTETVLTITEFNLAAMERSLITKALKTAGSIVEAALLLGITRQKVKREIIKHHIEYPFPAST